MHIRVRQCKRTIQIHNPKDRQAKDYKNFTYRFNNTKNYILSLL